VEDDLGEMSRWRAFFFKVLLKNLAQLRREDTVRVQEHKHLITINRLEGNVSQVKPAFANKNWLAAFRYEENPYRQLSVTDRNLLRSYTEKIIRLAELERLEHEQQSQPAASGDPAISS